MLDRLKHGRKMFNAERFIQEVLEKHRMILHFPIAYLPDDLRKARALLNIP
jgi:hypothetical protein